MGILASLLPTKYSPLRKNGDGLQSVYLAEVPKPFAEVLAGLIGAEAGAVLHQAAILSLPADGQAAHHPIGDDLDYWEHRLEQTVVQDAAIPETEREAIVRSRRGQGAVQTACPAARATLPNLGDRQAHPPRGQRQQTLAEMPCARQNLVEKHVALLPQPLVLPPEWGRAVALDVAGRDFGHARSLAQLSSGVDEKGAGTHCH
jgi:hypothetical protein